MSRTKNSLQEFALRRFEFQQGFSLNRSGHRKAILDFVRKHYRDDYSDDPEDWKKQVDWLRDILSSFMPDGWALLEDDPCGDPVFIFVEVEDTNTMTQQKLDDYTDLFEQLDVFGGHPLAICITDRYGTITTTLEGRDLWWMRWSQDPPPPAANTPTTSASPEHSPNTASPPPPQATGSPLPPPASSPSPSTQDPVQPPPSTPC